MLLALGQQKILSAKSSCVKLHFGMYYTEEMRITENSRHHIQCLNVMIKRMESRMSLMFLNDVDL